MAKRSVRKQRQQGTPAGTARGREPEPQPDAPVWRSSAFWLGGLVVGLAVAVIAVAAFVLVGSGDDTPSAAAPTPAADDGTQTAEEVQAEFDERDREQVEALTTQAKSIAADLQPVMDGLGEALPREGAAPAQVDDAQVQEWLAAARDAAEPFEESVSGDTGHNVARSTVRAALDGLVTAIETYRLAGDAGSAREGIVEQAAAQRDNAVRTWSAAAIQLDAVNIDAGFGHQHVNQLGGAGSGAQPPDTLPEGTDARPQE